MVVTGWEADLGMRSMRVAYRSEGADVVLCSGWMVSEKVKRLIRVAHRSEGAAAGAGIGLAAGGGPHDAPVGDDDHILPAELLL